MKNIVLFILILIYPTFSYANTDDCKTDVYFANGIKTEKRDAIENTGLLRKEIKNMLGTEAYTQKIGKVAYAYNETNGFILDGLETVYQKFGWTGLFDVFGASHGRDLDKQIKAYQSSINAKHKVLVVAHSQGNLFTYEAYTALSSDMKKDFEAVSIASPTSADIKPGTTRIDFDNDIVPRIATVGASQPWMLPNNVRNISWESNNVFGVGKPSINYTAVSNIGETYTNSGYSYVATEAGIDLAYKVHAFTFYMGRPLGEADGDDLRDPFTNTTLVDLSAKALIMQEISTKLDILRICKDKKKDKCHSTKRWHYRDISKMV